MRHSVPLLAFLGSLALAGCGGGGSEANLAPEPEVTSGPMRIQGQVKTPTIATSTTGLSVFGFAGTITKAYWTDSTPTLAETEIVFSMSTMRDGDQIVACEPDGSNLRVIANLTNWPQQIRVSPDGAWVYFSELDVLKRVPMAGGAVTTQMADVRYFALTPSGTRVLAFRPVADDVVIANVNGSGIDVRVNSAITDSPRIVGCVSEQKGLVLNRYSYDDPIMYVADLNGPQLVSGYLFFSSAILSGMELHPSRDRVLYRHFYGGDGKVRLTEGVLRENGMSATVLRDDLYGGPDFSPFAISPDGTAYVGRRGGVGLVVTDRLENVTGTILTGELFFNAVAWAPSPTFRTFVGAGNYAGGAGALLFSSKDGRTPSVVLADGTPRSSMNVSRVSGDNDSTIIYDVTCDNLSKLHFTKSNSFAQVSVVGSIVGLKGAFVVFNTATGRVDNVITYTKKPTVSRQPGGISLEDGDMVEHIDGSGNRKPAGRRVVLD